MLDIKKVQSTNTVTIVGTLSELDIKEGSTSDGRKYVRGNAIVKVDQTIGGKQVENNVPVTMFSMQKKKDGTDNPTYSSILQMKENFISLAAAEAPHMASRIKISNGTLQENNWIDKQNGTPRSSFQIAANFINKANEDEPDCAKFELSGVIGNITEEEKNDEATGRLLIKFITVGWLGRAEVIQLIAENPIAVTHIQSNWEKGDTVSLTGAINMSYKVVTWEEEQGFGEPIKRSRTESTKELLITGGSPSGLEEEFSYDADSIKLALDERTERIAELAEKKTKAATPAPKANDFGF